jgi:hypothetical protein
MVLRPISLNNPIFLQTSELLHCRACLKAVVLYKTHYKLVKISVKCESKAFECQLPVHDSVEATVCKTGEVSLATVHPGPSLTVTDATDADDDNDNVVLFVAECTPFGNAEADISSLVSNTCSTCAAACDTFSKVTAASFRTSSGWTAATAKEFDVDKPCPKK